MIESNPNQKMIHVVKEVSNSENLYSIFNLKALQYALTNLEGNEFKLWCYLNKNQKNHEFALSKVDALRWGIGSASSYSRAVATLIKEGFLVETSPNHYDFYELPKKEEEDKVIYITKVDSAETLSPKEEPTFRF